MEKTFWQNKSHARLSMIVYLIIGFGTLPFMLAYNFNKSTVIIGGILLALSILLFLADAIKGTFNRVGISKDGFWVKKLFNKTNYSWLDVQECKETIALKMPITSINYQIILKKKDKNGKCIIDIQKHNNADGEIEKYIDVKMMRSKEIENKKSSLLIFSWRERIKKMVFKILIIDICLIIAALFPQIYKYNYDILIVVLRTSVIVIFIELILVLLVLRFRRKKRIEIDHRGIEVYIYDKRFSIAWNDIKEIIQLDEMNDRLMGKFYRIMIVDKNELPFNALIINKTKRNDRLIKEFYNLT
jgi:hypothetical protein